MKAFIYHGTDEKSAKSIIKNGFVVKQNDEHWLGNGIYFYFDPDLAKWWTTRPTSKFGVEIKNPVLIEASLFLDDSKILDLRKISEFQKLIDYEKRYRKVVALTANGDIPYKKYRCSLFDNIFEDGDTDLIIGGFYQSKSNYMSAEINILLSKLKMSYTQIQICVKPSAQKDVFKITNIIKAEEI